MNFNELLNPGTTLGAFLISILASLIAGAIAGFFCGKSYEKRITMKSIQKGDGNVNIQASKITR